MQKTILQVPLDRSLKDSAEKAAYSQGFSSLQEMIRVFLSKLSENKIEVTIQETIKLSESSEKRYIKMTRDFQKDKNVYSAESVDDLIVKLK